MSTRVIVFVLKFLLLAAFFIVSNQNLALIEADNRAVFFDEYVSWVVAIGGEIGTLTGYVVDVDWLPERDGVSSDPASRTAR